MHSQFVRIVVRHVALLSDTSDLSQVCQLVKALVRVGGMIAIMSWALRLAKKTRSLTLSILPVDQSVTLVTLSRPWVRCLSTAKIKGSILGGFGALELVETSGMLLLCLGLQESISANRALLVSLGLLDPVETAIVLFGSLSIRDTLGVLLGSPALGVLLGSLGLEESLAAHSFLLSSLSLSNAVCVYLGSLALG